MRNILSTFAFARSSSTRCNVVGLRDPLTFTANTLKDRLSAVGGFFNQLPGSINTSRSVRARNVRLLFLNRSPLAVCFRIPFIVVYTLYSQFFRLVPHISPEVKKVTPPFFTDSNSSTSISNIVSVFRIMASLNHSLPYSICFALVLSMSKIKCPIMAFLTLCRTSLSKMSSSYNPKLFTYTTLTNPFGLSLFGVWSALHNSPITKLFPSHVFQRFHILSPNTGRSY